MKLNGRKPAGYRKRWSWMSTGIRPLKAYKVPKIEQHDQAKPEMKMTGYVPMQDHHYREVMEGTEAKRENRIVVYGTDSEGKIEKKGYIKNQLKIKRINIPVPKISLDQFMFLMGMTIVFLAMFMGLMIFSWVKDDIDYKQRVREDIRYNIEKAMTVDRAKIQAMEYDLQELNGFKEAVEGLVKPKPRKPMKYRVGHSNKYIVR